jgi:site-specific DNA-methyltransferase (adenine-specific)
MNTELMFSSKTDLWSTPQAFFNELNKEFNFTLDPCANKENAKCEKYYTKEDNGLIQDWKNEIVFCNPPYGRELNKWVKKCYEESKHAKIVMLIPARTDTSYFHDYIYNKAEIKFIRGRLKFGDSKNSAPFPSMVVIF